MFVSQGGDDHALQAGALLVLLPHMDWPIICSRSCLRYLPEAIAKLLWYSDLTKQFEPASTREPHT